jgi:hypothetical protein
MVGAAMADLAVIMTSMETSSDSCKALHLIVYCDFSMASRTRTHLENLYHNPVDKQMYKATAT